MDATGPHEAVPLPSVALTLLVILMLLALVLVVRGLREGKRAKRPIALAGLPSSCSSSVARPTSGQLDLLRFELEVLRLVNDARRHYGVHSLTLHGPLLAEARRHSSDTSRNWHCFRLGLAARMRQRGRFSSGLEVVSVLRLGTPEAVLGRWMARRKIRRALLSGSLELGAVGCSLDLSTSRGCVTLLLAGSGRR
jgi:hypothetical protein